MNVNGPKLGLVTVLYNSPEVLADFFRSVALQSYKNYVVYIVDNSSAPEPLAISRELCQQHGIQAVFIDNQGNNVGVAAGNNQGTEQALQDSCDYVLYINNDLLFENSSLFSDLVKTAVAGQPMVSPLILNYPAKKIWYAGGGFDELRATAPHFNIDNDYIAADIKAANFNYAPTCFLLVARDVVEKVGQMDEEYFAYYDDTDFLYRAMKKGFSVYLAANSIIYHKVGSSTGGDLSYFGMYHLTRNRIYFIKKNYQGYRKQLSLSYVYCNRLAKILLCKGELRKACWQGLIAGFKYA